MNLNLQTDSPVPVNYVYTPPSWPTGINNTHSCDGLQKVLTLYQAQLPILGHNCPVVMSDGQTCRVKCPFGYTSTGFFACGASGSPSLIACRAWGSGGSYSQSGWLRSTPFLDRGGPWGDLKPKNCRKSRPGNLPFRPKIRGLATSRRHKWHRLEISRAIWCLAPSELSRGPFSCPFCFPTCLARGSPPVA